MEHPHPAAPLSLDGSALVTMRARIALEVAILGGLTALYLGVWPWRVPGMDIGLAMVGLVLLWCFGRSAHERIWGPPASSGLTRLRRGSATMLRFTLPMLVAFAAVGVWHAYGARQQWADVPPGLFTPRFFLLLTIYIPWALMQQAIFQFYLLGRLRVLVPSASPVLVAAVNGVVFGAVHWPEWDVVVITIAAGLVWSYAYQRDRSLVPIAVSHALLGTAYFTWVRQIQVARILWFVLAGDTAFS